MEHAANPVVVQKVPSLGIAGEPQPTRLSRRIRLDDRHDAGVRSIVYAAEVHDRRYERFIEAGALRISSLPCDG